MLTLKQPSASVKPDSLLSESVGNVFMKVGPNFHISFRVKTVTLEEN